MDAALGSQAGATADPHYWTATEHAQAGRWEQAIQSFEELARAYPGDHLVQKALRDTRFRAGLDERTKSDPGAGLSGGGRCLFELLLLLAIGVLAWQGVQVIKHQFVPARAQAARRATPGATARGGQCASGGRQPGRGRSALPPGTGR